MGNEDRISPAAPPRASEAWPENVAAHDQAATALRNWLVEDVSDEGSTSGEHKEDLHWKTILSIAHSMPSHASVAVVIEFEDGHLIATLLGSENSERPPTLTILFYDRDDPTRLKEALNAQVVLLTKRPG